MDKRTVAGARVPLTTFAAAVAVAVSLMFVTVLLASGALALEREQNTFTRLVRGPVSRTALLAEKVVFAVAGSVPVTLLMLLAVSVFVTVEWDRFHLWLVAAVAGAAAFAAMGTLIGALAREVQAASLLAFTLLLPVAFLALVPEGALSSALYDVTRVVSALFPFDATVDAATLGALRRGWAAGPAAAPGGAGGRLRRRSPGCDLAAWLGAPAGQRISCLPACLFRPRGSDGCDRRAAFAAWCARPSCRSTISCTRCSSRTARTGASRSSRCPASSA